MKNQPRFEGIDKGVIHISVSIFYFEKKYFHNFLMMLKYPMGHSVGIERMILQNFHNSKRTCKR